MTVYVVFVKGVGPYRAFGSREDATKYILNKPKDTRDRYSIRPFVELRE